MPPLVRRTRRVADGVQRARDAYQSRCPLRRRELQLRSWRACSPGTRQRPAAQDGQRQRRSDNAGECKGFRPSSSSQRIATHTAMTPAQRDVLELTRTARTRCCGHDREVTATAWRERAGYRTESGESGNSKRSGLGHWQADQQSCASTRVRVQEQPGRWRGKRAAQHLELAELAQKVARGSHFARVRGAHVRARTPPGRKIGRSPAPQQRLLREKISSC